MNKQTEPKWAAELCQDFPQYEENIQRIFMTTEHFRELVRDYFACKSKIKKLTKEPNTMELNNNYQSALHELKLELIEFLEKSDK